MYCTETWISRAIAWFRRSSSSADGFLPAIGRSSFVRCGNSIPPGGILTRRSREVIPQGRNPPHDPRRRHPRFRLRGLDRRHLRRARQPRPAGAGWPRTGGTADADHRCRELPRIPRRDPGTGARRPHAEAGGTVRSRVPRGNGRRRGPFEAPLRGEHGGEHLHGAHPHRRHRRLGPAPGPGIGEEADGEGRIHLRHLRRRVLPGPRDRRGRRGRHRAGGGDLPHPVRVEGAARPSKGPVPRLEDHGRPGPEASRRSSSSSTP